MNNTISLIIAYYNGSEFIEEAIQSAQRQTLPFDEIILVDDGSRLEEAQFAEELSSKYGVIYINQSNGGQGSARNTGCKLAKSEYLCFLDQDDVLSPEHNKILINSIFEQTKYTRGCVYANFSCSQSNGLVVSKKSRPDRVIDTLPTLYHFIYQDIFILPSACMIYKEAFLTVGGFDDQFRGYEDDDLFIRLFRAGYQFSYVNEDVYVWRTHDNQTSSSALMLKSRMKFIEKWLDCNYDKSINIQLIRQSLFNRFKGQVLKDVIDAKNSESHSVATVCAKNFSNTFYSIMSWKMKIAFFLIRVFPTEISKILLNFLRSLNVVRFFR